MYLSFERYGTKSGGTLAQAAGNQAEVTCVDDRHLIIVNGSCSEYWLRVVAGGRDGAEGRDRSRRRRGRRRRRWEGSRRGHRRQQVLTATPIPAEGALQP